MDFRGSIVLSLCYQFCLVPVAIREGSLEYFYLFSNTFSFANQCTKSNMSVERGGNLIYTVVSTLSSVIALKEKKEVVRALPPFCYPNH